jgi:hypothetical protein
VLAKIIVSVSVSRSEKKNGNVSERGNVKGTLFRLLFLRRQ